MIDENKIEEAAKLYAWNNRSDEGGEEDLLDKKRAFRSGINWFLDNLWHNASEEPTTTSKVNEFVECLVKFKNGIVNLYDYDTFHHWWVCDLDNEEFLEKISCWFYIDDLLKEGK